MTAAVPAGDRGACVAELTREHFGVWVDIPSRGAAGYLYAIRDEYNDGYPSRHLVLVDEDGGAAEEEFTDSNPSGYPKTMQTPCLIRDERPAECVGQTALALAPAPVPGAFLDRLEEVLREATPGLWEHITDDHGRKGVEHSIWEAGHESGDLGDYVAEQVDTAADAALIVAAVNALPELLRLAREGQALRAKVLNLAAQYRTLGAVLHSVPSADAYREIARELRTLVADTSGEAGQ